MIPVKDRKLVPGQRVQVYYNLHKGGYSIRDKKTGLVVAYADNVLLQHKCLFKVQQAGRLKTIEERQKRVHAYVEGHFETADLPYDTTFMSKVYYNPYQTEEFTNEIDGSHVFNKETVYLVDKVCYTD